jgi:hypothetical protein
MTLFAMLEVMTHEEAEAKYLEPGLITRYIVDKPGEVYEPHEHEVVYRFTLEG